MSFFAVIIIVILIFLLIFSVYKGLIVQKRAKMGGDTGIIGAKGKCVKKYSEKRGKIFIMGEFWDVKFSDNVKEGDMVLVVDVIDNMPVVKKVSDD